MGQRADEKNLSQPGRLLGRRAAGFEAEGRRNIGQRDDFTAIAATQADAAGRRCWKHSRQSTGRPCVGLNGTVVSLPHCEHTARVSVRDEPWCPVFAAPRTATRFALQALHRLGSFLNCLSWKNNCSPDVKTKSAPQSMHFNILSRNSIEDAPSARS
jgi:hypothetical protein